MKRYRVIGSLVALVFLLLVGSSCRDDVMSRHDLELEQGGDHAVTEAEVTIGLGVPEMEEHLRANLSPEAEAVVRDLYLFVFDETGNVKQKQYLPWGAFEVTKFDIALKQEQSYVYFVEGTGNIKHIATGTSPLPGVTRDDYKTSPTIREKNNFDSAVTKLDSEEVIQVNAGDYLHVVDEGVAADKTYWKVVQVGNVYEIQPTDVAEMKNIPQGKIVRVTANTFIRTMPITVQSEGNVMRVVVKAGDKIALLANIHPEVQQKYEATTTDKSIPNLLNTVTNLSGLENLKVQLKDQQMDLSRELGALLMSGMKQVVPDDLTKKRVRIPLHRHDVKVTINLSAAPAVMDAIGTTQKYAAQEIEITGYRLVNIPREVPLFVDPDKEDLNYISPSREYFSFPQTDNAGALMHATPYIVGSTEATDRLDYTKQKELWAPDSSHSLTFYVPAHYLGKSRNTEINSFESREVRNRAPGDTRIFTFKNAPENATFVEVHARYFVPDPIKVERAGTGGVTYTKDPQMERTGKLVFSLHLGMMGKDQTHLNIDGANTTTQADNMKIFTLWRNSHYIYNMKMLEGTDIILESISKTNATSLPNKVEYDDEERPSLEGEITDTSNRLIFDAHHGTHKITISTKQLQKIKESVLKNTPIPVYVRTPFETYEGDYTHGVLKDGQWTPGTFTNGGPKDVNWLRFTSNEIRKESSFVSRPQLEREGWLLPYTWSGRLRARFDNDDPIGGGVPHPWVTEQVLDAHMNLVEFANHLSYMVQKYPDFADAPRTYTIYVNEYYYWFDPITSSIKDTKISEIKELVALRRKETGDDMNQDLWKRFVNQPDREIRMFYSQAVSKDQHSRYMDAIFMVSQQSIKTFYNPMSQGLKNAYGMESIEEPVAFPVEIDYRGFKTRPKYTPLEGAALMAYEIPMPQRSNQQQNLDNRYNEYRHERWQLKYNRYLTPLEARVAYNMSYNNGHFNQLMELQAPKNLTGRGTLGRPWDEIYDANINRLTEDFSYVRFSCLARNRDENFDGYLDAEEVQWYLPAINQLLDLQMFSDAFDPSIRLYTPEYYGEGRYGNDYVYTNHNAHRQYASSTAYRRGEFTAQNSNNPITLVANARTAFAGLIDVDSYNRGYLRYQTYTRCVRDLGIGMSPSLAGEIPRIRNIQGEVDHFFPVRMYQRYWLTMDDPVSREKESENPFNMVTTVETNNNFGDRDQFAAYYVEMKHVLPQAVRQTAWENFGFEKTEHTVWHEQNKLPRRWLISKIDLKNDNIKTTYMRHLDAFTQHMVENKLCADRHWVSDEAKEKKSWYVPTFNQVTFVWRAWVTGMPHNTAFTSRNYFSSTLSRETWYGSFGFKRVDRNGNYYRGRMMYNGTNFIPLLTLTGGPNYNATDFYYRVRCVSEAFENFTYSDNLIRK